MSNFWKEFCKWSASVVIVGAAIGLLVYLYTLLKTFIVFALWVVGIAAVAFAIYKVKMIIDKLLKKNDFLINKRKNDYKIGGIDKTIDVTTPDETISVDISAFSYELENIKEIFNNKGTSKQDFYSNEILTALKKNVVAHAFKDYTTIEEITDESPRHNSIKDWLSQFKDLTEAFIITNGAVAASIQDLSGYIHDASAITNAPSALSPYYVGKINNIEVYVDAYMRWDDCTIRLFQNNFYNYKFVTNTSLYNKEYYKTLKPVSSDRYTISLGTLNIKYTKVIVSAVKINNLQF